MNLLVFLNFEPKKCFRVPTPWGLYGAEWDGRLFSLCSFKSFSLFGDLSHRVLPTLRGVSGDVVTAYAYQDTKGRFLQSLALPRAGQGPCERRKMTVSTNLLLQFFTLYSSKIKVSETFFLHCDHSQSPSEVCKALIRQCLGALFGYWVRAGGGGLPRDWYITCLCSFSPWTAQKKWRSPHRGC